MIIFLLSIVSPVFCLAGTMAKFRLGTWIVMHDFVKLTSVVFAGSIYFSQRNSETSDATVIFCCHSGYVSVFQESEKGSWHVPIVYDGNEESARTWLCITRPGACEDLGKTASNIETCENGNGPCCKSEMSNTGDFEILPSDNRNQASQDFFQMSYAETPSITGKRKERSP
ncbi:hypothetical protein QQP08_026726 [Theobroma cacao]|nr:hypothetical protein QQP08_026726 [Theobroma cacao]